MATNIHAHLGHCEDCAFFKKGKTQFGRCLAQKYKTKPYRNRVVFTRYFCIDKFAPK